MVWSLGFYGGTINYLGVAHCEESGATGGAVFDQKLFTIDDCTDCMICMIKVQTKNTIQYSI